MQENDKPRNKARRKYRKVIGYASIAKELGITGSALCQRVDAGMNYQQREDFLMAFIKLSNEFLEEHKYRVRFGTNRLK